MANGGGGGGLKVALLLLVILAVAGGWNYHRNVGEEEAALGHRPFKGYSDADLEQLAQAYRDEADRYQQRLSRVRDKRVEARDSELLAERVREFERVQRHSDQTRSLMGDVAEREGRLREIEDELAYRERLTSGVALHVARLIGI